MYTSGRLNTILHNQRAGPRKHHFSLWGYSHGVYVHRLSIMYYHSAKVLGVWPFNLQKVYSFGMRFYRMCVLRRFNSVMVSFCSGMPIYAPMYIIYIYSIYTYTIYIYILTVYYAGSITIILSWRHSKYFP